MVMLLVGFANTALACPEGTPLTADLEARRAEHAAAKQVVRGTDWDYLMALDDRDEVLARQAQAMADLRAARVAVREARRQARGATDTTGVVCDPAVPAPTTSG